MDTKNASVTARLRVAGMSCARCERKIEEAVRALDGVGKARADAPLGEVSVTFDPGRVDLEGVREAVRGAGYAVEQGGADGPRVRKAVTTALGLLAILAAAYLLARFTGKLSWLPAVNGPMDYGLLFLTGLLTSVHCVAMCGGIALSQGLRTGPAAGPGPLPGVLYNAGRIVSYTAVGGFVGALGSVLSLSATLQGLLPALAGLFMLFLGVRMLGVLPRLSRLRLPRFGRLGERASRAASRGGPFAVGLLNGLMPCGPLQTMQVYALGTGNAASGALSMLLFGLGTVPLMLGFSALGSLLGARSGRRLARAGGGLVLVLGLVMVFRGMSLFGVGLPEPPSGASASGAAARAEGGFQAVRTTLDSGTYHPLTVRKGIPVRWTVSVQAADLNGCNRTLTVPRFGIRKNLVPGDNLIEFTPDRSGDIPYTCWMGMISSTIHVVDDSGAGKAVDLAFPGKASR